MNVDYHRNREAVVQLSVSSLYSVPPFCVFCDMKFIERSSKNQNNISQIKLTLKQKC